MELTGINAEEAKNISPDGLFERLSSSRDGLSSQEAKNRIEKFGLNEIVEKKVSPFIKFLSYFWGPIPWMIEVAAILSTVIHHWEDFWIISTLLRSEEHTSELQSH